MDDLRLLQQPPAKDEAATKTLNILNSRLPSWESLLKSSEFDAWVEHSQADATALKAQASVTLFQGLEILMHTSLNLQRRC
jgi:hypothetical protein